MIITKKNILRNSFFVQQHLSHSLSSSAPPLPFPSVNLAAVISAALADLTQEDRNIWILFCKIIPLCFSLPCWHTHKTVRAETPTAAPPKHYVSAGFSQFHHSFCIEKIHFWFLYSWKSTVAITQMAYAKWLHLDSWVYTWCKQTLTGLYGLISGSVIHRNDSWCFTFGSGVKPVHDDKLLETVLEYFVSQDRAGFL